MRTGVHLVGFDFPDVPESIAPTLSRVGTSLGLCKLGSDRPEIVAVHILAVVNCTLARNSSIDRIPTFCTF